MYSVGATTLLHVSFASMSAFVLGYDLAFIGSVLIPVQQACGFCFPCPDETNLLKCTCPAKQFAVSAVGIGAFVGALSGGALADYIGRRKATICTNFVFALGSAAMASAGMGPRAYLFFLGRMLSGISVGASGGISTTYIAEISPSKQRGALIQVNEIMICIGCLTAFIVAATIGDAHWRTTVLIPVVPAVVQALGFSCLLYESPRWLALDGQADLSKEAAIALQWSDSDLHRHENDGHGILASSTPAPDGHAGRYRLLENNKGVLLLAVGIAVAHNCLATSTILFYSRSILEQAGLQSVLKANIAVGATKLVGACVCLALVDSVGRKPLLIAGTAGVVAGYAGLVLANQGSPDPVLAFRMFLLCIFAWTVSWAGLMLTIVSEVLPQSIRGFGVGLAYSVYWLLSFVQEQTLESAFASLTVVGTFTMYGCLSIGALVFAVFCVPETMGVPLHDASDKRMGPSYGATPDHQA